MVEVPVLPECVDNTVKNLADKPAQVIGQTIADLWQLALGSRVTFAVEKKKLKYANDLEEYRKTLEEHVNNIPVDKLIDPSMQVAAQSLVDSQYCIDEEDLREMFAKLIARSMHADYCSRIHPSFSKIIQQLSSLDAQMLRFFHRDGHDVSIPIAHIVGYDDSKSAKVTIMENIPAVMPEHCSEDDAARSIVVLSHLGLIAIPGNRYLADPTRYEVFTSSQRFSGYQRYWRHEGYRVEIEKHIAELTPFGKDFVSVCLG